MACVANQLTGFHKIWCKNREILAFNVSIGTKWVKWRHNLTIDLVFTISLYSFLEVQPDTLTEVAVFLNLTLTRLKETGSEKHRTKLNKNFKKLMGHLKSIWETWKFNSLPPNVLFYIPKNLREPLVFKCYHLVEKQKIGWNVLRN